VLDPRTVSAEIEEAHLAAFLYSHGRLVAKRRTRRRPPFL
jgi:hypothetical protein